MALWGLDCPNPLCIHDGRFGYRLDFWVTDGGREAQTVRWRRERNPVIFREGELISAKDQLVALGAPPEIGMHVLDATQTPDLPVDMVARRVQLSRVLLPRTALYLRWKPEADEVLSADNCFQCVFMPGATASERRCAPERRVPVEEFQHVFSQQVAADSALRTSTSALRCQHCHQALPLRQFNTLTLREVEKGD